MAQVYVMDTQGFPYGLNLSRSENAIGDGELAQAENCEYGAEDGALRTMAGIRTLYESDDPIRSIYFSQTPYGFLLSKGVRLYSCDSAFSSVVALGMLSGDKQASYVMFGNVILISSGGKLQYVDENGLHTIDGSPDVCEFVTVRQGRVLTYATNSDRLCYSAIGDYLGWTPSSADTSSAQFINIGYKDPGNIVAIDFLSKCIVAYKAGGRAYKIVGEPQDSDYSVQPISQTAYCENMRCVANVDDKSYYLGSRGFKSFVPTQVYGDVAPFDEGLNINPWIISPDANARIWHLPSRNQLWVKEQNDKRIYVYHYIPRYSDGRGVFTIRTTTHNVNDVCTMGNNVYVAYGNKVGILDEARDTDDGRRFRTIIKGNKRLASKHDIVVLNRTFVSHNILPGYGSFRCGKHARPLTFGTAGIIAYDADMYAYDADMYAYNEEYTKSYRAGGGPNKYVQIVIMVEEGAISLRKCSYEYIEV